MALTNAYLMTTKNLESFLNSIKTAKAPERFNIKFLQQLDFASSNDRLFIGLMKGLEAVREAYEDLFAVNINANEMTVEDVKNKLRTLTMGQKSDNVLNLMANTFKSLSELADWGAPASDTYAVPVEPEEKKIAIAEAALTRERGEEKSHKETKLQLHYNIQIHLPESRDPAVFDAIFEALKKHIG